MAATLTITSKTGPGLTVTSQVITNVESYHLDFGLQQFQVVANGITSFYDIAADTTFTITRSGNNWTLVIS